MTVEDPDVELIPEGKRQSDFGCQVVFTRAGIVELQSVADPKHPQETAVSIRNRLSLISPGTELAQLHDRTGALKSVNFPMHVRAYCIGSIRGCAGSEDKSGRVLYRGYHASRILAPLDPDRSLSVPSTVSDTEALICTQAIPGAYALARADNHHGATVAVIGLGVVGHLLVRLLALQKPDKICGIDPHPLRRTCLNDIGLVATAKMDTKLVNNRFDSVFVACPDPDALLKALRAVVPGGTVIQLAAPYEPVTIDIANMVFRKNVRLQGCHDVGIDLGLTDYPSKADLLSDLLGLVVEGKMDLSRIAIRTFAPRCITHVYAELSGNKDALHSAFLDWTYGH